MSKIELTPAMVTVLKSWGWGDETWDKDVVLARALTLPGELSHPVIDLLKGMGWEWTMTCHNAYDWLKFNPAGTCEAQRGDQCWIADVEAVKLLAAEEVWVPTMELRRQLTHHNHVLQQKWERAGAGGSEWRTVPTVDEKGEPYA